mmetsp:Transcript_31357/g.35670  ORF Transcript_31357/g.35670 Transcript_31357/m.35670 type:complete len:288 (+) Transcript_31357:305-1168(+)|eukprot:CAMPEP_0194136062 /NCGR_PEP_ID=MMETSP0152-20130528/6095_1 /TAXON_ID=1049557 /ORGANISM="Thalassiothrix antarctica, Strain L6-D1" /LENGTH=287 /DNA_ID=CAMNT_0038832555 /DNA_START=232 /DNA_END=1095 /DNA_ORIENTATION=+
MPTFDNFSSPNAKSNGDNNSNDETKKYPNTPLQRYMQELQQYQRESVASIYTHAVDRPCLRNMCEAETDGDYFLTCHQPLSFLPFVKGGNGAFGGGETNEGDDWIMQEDSVLPMAGAYTVPSNCEYCGSVHVSMCDPITCQRPKLFFRKKCPPFCRPDSQKWDPITEFEITVKEEEKEEDNKNKDQLEQNNPLLVNVKEFKQFLDQSSLHSPSKSVKHYPYYPIPTTATTTSTITTTPVTKQEEAEQFNSKNIPFTKVIPTTPMAWMMREFFGIQKNKATQESAVVT